MGLKTILSAQIITDLITTNVKEDNISFIPRLSYRIDHPALQRLSQERLVRTMLVSDHRARRYSSPQLLSCTGRAGMEDATIKELINNSFQMWSKTNISWQTLIIGTFKSFEMILYTLVIWGFLRLAGSVNPGLGGIGQISSP
jgi:hypothetical protein